MNVIKKGSMRSMDHKNIYGKRNAYVVKTNFSKLDWNLEIHRK